MSTITDITAYTNDQKAEAMRDALAATGFFDDVVIVDNEVRASKNDAQYFVYNKTGSGWHIGNAHNGNMYSEINCAATYIVTTSKALMFVIVGGAYGAVVFTEQDGKLIIGGYCTAGQQGRYCITEDTRALSKITRSSEAKSNLASLAEYYAPISDDPFWLISNDIYQAVTYDEHIGMGSNIPTRVSIGGKTYIACVTVAIRDE